MATNNQLPVKTPATTTRKSKPHKQVCSPHHLDALLLLWRPAPKTRRTSIAAPPAVQLPPPTCEVIRNGCPPPELIRNGCFPLLTWMRKSSFAAAGMRCCARVAWSCRYSPTSSADRCSRISSSARKLWRTGGGERGGMRAQRRRAAGGGGSGGGERRAAPARQGTPGCSDHDQQAPRHQRTAPAAPRRSCPRRPG